MERILKLDAQLTRLFKGIDEHAHSLSFELVGDLLEADLDDIKVPGLYLIEIWSGPRGTGQIQEWLNEFSVSWTQEEFKRCFVPSCQKARMKKHVVLQEWMPVYLGKSMKIGRRIWEHLNLGKDQRTFALKLKARNLLEGRRYRLSVLRLPVKQYKVIAPLLEDAMRRKHLPLVGRE